MNELKKGRGRPKKAKKEVNRITELNKRKKHYEQQIKSLTKGKKASELTAEERGRIGTAKYQINKANRAIANEYLTNEKYAGNKRFETMAKNLVRSANASDRARKREKELRRYGKNLGGRWERADTQERKNILHDLKRGKELREYYKNLSASEKRKMTIMNKEYARAINKHKREVKEQLKIEKEMLREAKLAEKAKAIILREEKKAERLREKEARAARNSRSPSDGSNIRIYGEIDEGKAALIYNEAEKGKSMHRNTLKYFSGSKYFEEKARENLQQEFKNEVKLVVNSAIKMAGIKYKALSRTRKMNVLTAISRDISRMSSIVIHRDRIMLDIRGDVTGEKVLKAYKHIENEYQKLTVTEKLKGRLVNEKIDVNEWVDQNAYYTNIIDKNKTEKYILEKFKINTFEHGNKVNKEYTARNLGALSKIKYKK